MSGKSSEFNFDTKVLAYMVAIMDEQNLSRAAEKMYLSQPALSRHLRRVEEELGTALFSREHNVLRPTSAGKIFINGARRMLHLEQEAHSRLKACRLERKSNLYIIAEDVYVQALEHQMRPTFSAAFPEIELHIEVGHGDEIKKQLSEGAVDLGVFIDSGNEQPFYTREKTVSTEIVFCTAANCSILKEGEAFSLNKFAGEPMMLSPRGSFLRQLQEQTLRECEIHAPNVICEGNLDVIAELLRLGYGNTIMLRRVAEKFVQRERIYPFAPPLQCNAVLARSQSCSASAQLDFCIQYISKILARF